MAQQIVSPGIADDYVCGKLVRKIYGEYKSLSTRETKIVELVSRSFEAVCDKCPFSLCTYSTFEVLSVVVKINEKEVELKSEKLEMSPEEKISSGRTEGPL